MTLLSDAKHLAESLKRTVKDLDRLSTAAHLGPGKAAHVIYEAYINLAVLADLQSRWSIRMENAQGKRKVRLPLGPADKRNYPYFIASDGVGDRFQVCFGTNVGNANGTTHAPDMSVQVANAPTSPKDSDVYFCWDQKYTEAANLDRDEVLVVRGKLELVMPSAASQVQPFVTGAVMPNANAIITNAGPSTLTSADLSGIKLVEVSGASPIHRATRRP